MPAENLKARTFNFAVSVGKLVQSLPQELVSRQYLGQIIRSSSSIAANYRAAQRAKSRADFINKLKIVEEETDETICFLELLVHFNPAAQKALRSLILEGTEILRIIVASINTARSKS